MQGMMENKTRKFKMCMWKGGGQGQGIKLERLGKCDIEGKCLGRHFSPLEFYR